MSYLFRNVNPNLGQQTTVLEQSGFGPSSGATPNITNNFKPTTRETLQLQLAAAPAAGGQFIFIAPWQCEVVALRATFAAASASGTLDLRRFTQAGLPQAPGTAANGTTVIELLSSPLSLSGTANTTVQATQYPLSAPGLTRVAADGQVLQAGDQLALVFGGTLTGLTFLLVQVEVIQLDGFQTNQI
jgi:hypothetical protein